MNSFIKSAGIAILALLLVFVFSTTAFANQLEVRYVYFEQGSLPDVFKVDYRDASIDEYPYKTVLYDEMVTGIHRALGSFRNVWVEARFVGETEYKIVHYSEAVKGQLSLSEALVSSAYIVNRPTVNFELVIDTFNRVARRVPKPVNYPAWLLDEQGNLAVNITKLTDVADKWVIDIYVNKDALPVEGAVLNDITDLWIYGEIAFAERDDNGNTGLWRLLIGSENIPTVEPGQVRIKIDKTWYN